ncbi:alpha-(1,3)-fucosyltransferase 7-like [Nelusetta ayraudi]|uniref:alpha-(1,3)-fucosyltransferase 7-like n=1 Tax=Nelusetta ayraudi TaxID=303726 RepID=UPI003F708C5D
MLTWTSIKMSILRSHRVRTSFIIVCFSMLLILYKFVNLNLVQNYNKTTGSDPKRSLNRTVLLWYRPWDDPFSLEGDVCWNLFKIPGCKLVDNRTYYSKADVVVFHHEELRTRQQVLPLSQPRPEGQKWAWLTMKSPDWNGNLKQLPNVFNMTITYRRDSDVYAPYGELQAREDGGQPVEGVPSNKTLFACWVVSNYESHHARSKVYEELKKFIPIKVYGRWVGNRIPSDILIPTLQKCYFYLAFENSNYKDYITETLWLNSYLAGAVPVVFGAGLDDYKAVAPPHSFIHVNEFATVKDLANYMMKLAHDKKRYNEYFTWKQKWQIKFYQDCRNILCKICTVYDSLPAYKVYSDLDAWILDK